jgi:catechol 2,3-dioxygenase-like lactoylglutathione lyase family enzyme
MRILRVCLAAAHETDAALRRFYRDQLGFPAFDGGGQHGFGVGGTRLEFSPTSEREPFYHFALRVPRNRFVAAREWLAGHAQLLSEPDSHETTFQFPNWNAEACYAHDPGGNIVELIAHRGLPDESPCSGPFAATELLGVCEIGLVGDNPPAMARALEPIGIKLWDGTLDLPGRLAFMGGPDGTLILAATGRGWMPTEREAELFEVNVDVAGAQDAEVTVPGTPHRVRTVVGRGPVAATWATMS